MAKDLEAYLSKPAAAKEENTEPDVEPGEMVDAHCLHLFEKFQKGRYDDTIVEQYKAFKELLASMK